MWIYIQTEPTLWTVGHYDPAGKWHTDSDHGSPEAAARRVHYLNGGRDAGLLAACEEAEAALSDLGAELCGKPDYAAYFGRNGHGLKLIERLKEVIARAKGG